MKVAILGFGTVGRGVYSIIESSQDFDNSLVLVRSGKKTENFQTEHIEEIVQSSSIETVVECMGGTDPAFSYVKQCLENKKNVVTSNKALVAEYGIELEKLARENGVSFLFSAACGGAIPVLSNISIATQSDKIYKAGGILNGTTNFILSKMQSEDISYADCLKEAQKLGYAEADPSADVSGLDTLRKIMLISAVSFGKIPKEGLSYEGIENFTPEIASDLKSKGRVLKLIGQTGLSENKNLYAFVEPVAVENSDIEASVLQNVNFAFYEAENSGKISLIGQGAGRFPTASAVLRDLSAVKSGIKTMLFKGIETASADNSEIKHNYYVCINGKTEILENVSVSEMHTRAKKLRKEGSEVFFAEYR